MSIFAELVGRLLFDLGDPEAENCSLEMAQTAIVAAHNQYAMPAKQSTTNVILSISEPFVPTSRKFLVAEFIGKGIPSGVEIETFDGRWRNIRVVNSAKLHEFENYGNSQSIGTNDITCAFFAQETGEEGMFLEFNSLPAVRVRIKFDADDVRKAIGSASLLPDHLDDLIILNAENRVIPRLKLKIGMNLARNEMDQKLVNYLANLYDGIYAQNRIDMIPLEALWKNWAFKERKNEGKSNARIPIGRNLYG